MKMLRSAFLALLVTLSLSVVRGTTVIPPTFDDLVTYCRCVAGSVGRLCLGVFGSRPDPRAVRRNHHHHEDHAGRPARPEDRRRANHYVAARQNY